MNRASIAAITVAGCFGEGPVPPTAADAPVVFVAPTPGASDVCDHSVYITSLAFGSDSGFAALYPYNPQNGNCNGGAVAGIQVDVRQFPIDGTNPTGKVVGNAGMASQQIPPPELAIGPMGPFAIFDTPGSPIGSMNAILPGGTPQSLQSGQVAYLTGVSAGVSGGFVATITTSMNQDPVSPAYPSGNGTNTGTPPQVMSTIYPLAFDGNTISLGSGANASALTPGELASAIVTNSTSVFYVVSSPGQFTIESVTGGVGSTIGTASQGGALVPVGLAADDDHVAWAFAQNAENFPLQLGCQIYATSLATGSGTGSNAPNAPLFASQDLSCMGLAIDPQAVYFAMVETDSLPSCDGCEPVLHGVGIGRVDFHGMFSSIAVDVQAAASGPRRIFTSPADPDDIFVLDPLVVAKISKLSFGDALH